MLERIYVLEMRVNGIWNRYHIADDEKAAEFETTQTAKFCRLPLSDVRIVPYIREV